MPACRQMSLTGTPASACLRIETIWVSVKRDFFMEPPGWGKHARKFYLWGVCGSGKLTGGADRPPIERQVRNIKQRRRITRRHTSDLYSFLPDIFSNAISDGLKLRATRQRKNGKPDIAPS